MRTKLCIGASVYRCEFDGLLELVINILKIKSNYGLWLSKNNY